ncbi:MATE family efflux transporter [Histidinibacterium lentulum]|uniref:MATE family efflux transporter n=2 Tax=Histidinibacterium lentulum TaxID=2480588 RepID=A0A3N2QTU9_9RHOB|nr:MATE family efflux transporter [Histidinibacterium lentulum]
MTLGIFGVLSIGLADAIFLGRLGGAPLAAIGFIFPVITAISSLSIGLAAGTNAAVSQAIGRGDGERTEHRLAVHAVGFGTAMACLVALAVWALHDPLFRLLGASDDVRTEIRGYMPLWALSFPFLVALMQTQAVFRAHGNGLVAGTVMFGSAVVNIALDPLFIFGWGPVPGMGTEGAALATLLARVLAFAAALTYAIRKDFLHWPRHPFEELGASIRQITRVGLPAAMSNAINPAGMAAVTAAVAVVGTTAVAGFGAATRVQSLALVPLMALSAGIGPVVGQNWGADRPDRAARGLALCFVFCGVYGLGIGAVLFLFAGPIGALIASDGEAAEFCAAYLRVVGWTLAGYGMLVTANAAMNARDRALWSMSLSLGRIALVYLPFAWAGVSLMGYGGIVAAAAAANLAGGAAAAWAAWRTGLLKLPERRPRAAAA